MEQYISSFRDGENIYYLNKEGRERVNSERVLKKSIQARHYIMRNEIYIRFGCPATWKNEIKLGFKEDKKTHIICDALFMKDKRYHIVEVDHTQKMTKNKNKIQRYRKLIEMGLFQLPPTFIWITTTELRRKQLMEYSKELDVLIYTVKDFQ